MPEVRLSIGADTRPERLAELSRELLNDLRRTPGLDATLAMRPATVGERTVDVPLVGQIILTFLSGGAAAALIGVLKSYMERDRSLSVKMKLPDGTELELDGKHVDQKVIDGTLRALKSLASH